MFVAVFIISVLLSTCVYSNNDYSNETQNSENVWPKNDYSVVQTKGSELSVNRTARFIGWWLGIGVGVVRFENSVCPAANGLRGTCYTRRQCSSVGGYASGKCARNIAVCCVVQATCGTTSSNNNTYFTNPNFPNTFPGGTACTLTVQRCNPDICQIRIDFLSLILSQPNGDGVCMNDALFINGAASPVGRICGENTGQHIYVDFNNGNDIDITIFTSAAVILGRQWNLKIAQIGCDSPSRAPTGCLMYYSDLSGTVTSFNYGQAANALSPVNNPGMPGTRQLSSMTYGVCIRMVPGYCSIQWSTTSGDPFAFTVSANTAIDTMAVPLLPPMIGSDSCTTDFVVIPNGVFTDAPNPPTQADRYCGNSFLPVTSTSKPFVLYVVTDANEANTALTNVDVANRGFSLSYSQQRCGSNLM